jgi:hypothetical protein
MQGFDGFWTMFSIPLWRLSKCVGGGGELACILDYGLESGEQFGSMFLR